MKHNTLLLISLLLATCWHGNAQVKINYNNNRKIDNKGFFKKDYQLKATRITAPPLESMRRMAEENTASLDKSFKFAEALPADIDVAATASWTTDANYSYGILAYMQIARRRSVTIRSVLFT